MRTIKIAIQAESGDADWLKQLALSNCGAQQIHYEAGVAPLLLPDGTLLEVYSPHAACPDYLFKTNKVVVSFKVDDIEQAVRTAIDQGLTTLVPITYLCTTLSYCHLSLADGTVIGLYQEKEHSVSDS
ncbi:hypothetical protein [Spirosoma sp. KNUC1025]|uniref:hypothetical protein n=1 Tax=Spirosoma sp. KNUC1025 TaxID=2894082 RepID=UPI00386F6A44|nr:hypothetical protein LN737_26950 [Spirosoma sp. KNUC1025]